MAKLTKKAKAIKEKVVSNKQYSVAEAVSLLKEFANSKFDESIDVSVNLGVDPRKSDQNVRGASVLPNGCLLYTSPSPRDTERSRMPSSA